MSLKCILDLETTGRSPKTEDIIQFTAILTDDNYNIVEVYDKRYYSPKINDFILNLLGLTLEEYQNLHTTRFSDDLQHIYDILKKADGKIYAYSWKFDQNFLNSNFARYGWDLGVEQINALPKQRIKLEQNLLQRGYHMNELIAQTKKYFPQARGFHDATVDTYGCYLIVRDDRM